MKTRLLHVRINVTDLAAARRFYRDILGFEEAGAWPPESPIYADYQYADGAVFAIERGVPGHGARCNFVVDDVRRLWTRLDGIVDVVEPFEDVAESDMRFVIRDPDGNELGFAQP
jgi:catechol 2,3-dioxygenase-like lactoylglutathione lyase family enzyme